MTNSNTDARKMALARSYREEAEDIMMWANWYKRQGNEGMYEQETRIANMRFKEAERLEKQVFSILRNEE